MDNDGRAGKVAEIRLDREILNPDGMRRFGERSLLVAEGGNGKKPQLVDLKGRLSRIDLTGNTGKVTPIRDGFSHGGVSVAIVGEMAYVLEGQITPLFRPDLFKNVKGPLYRIIAVSVGKP